jgi:hypothetical protein
VLVAFVFLNFDGGTSAPLLQFRIYVFAPWHFLYFFPDPQGQGSLRPTFAPVRTGFGASACAGPV